MSEKRWYRSLYGRLALGLVAFLTLTLIAQAALFVWLVERTAGSMPASSPRRLAVLVASDVAAAIYDNPFLDVQAYLQDQYAAVFQPFGVMLRDGRVVSNRRVIPGELREVLLLEAAREDLARSDGRRSARLGGRWVEAPAGAEAATQRAWEVAPIIVQGRVAGRVVVLATPAFSRVIRELGPTMGVLASGVLAAGMTLVALLVFGPARRRLRQLETATERLGAGDLTARAPEGGGDEVSSLARAFNRMAEELLTRADALEASEDARRQLFADVSHELMTPLTAMRGYLETLKMREIALDTETRARYLGIVEDETRRLERLVGDLLDLARLQGGGGALRYERVSVAALFERVVARHAPQAAARGDRLVTRIAPGAELVVDGDSDRLEQALQNLAGNALRHTRDGTEVVLSAEARDGRIHLQVRDNGAGIPVEHLPLIFDRFYKADASRHAGGSGLGLSIVKAIVERHGGQISARNDGGAVFDIVLPAPTLKGERAFDGERAER